jgi:hypothetical protein
MKLNRLAVIATSAAAGVTLLAGPMSSAAATAGHHTEVFSSCAAAKYKPSNYILSCADANNGIHHATYSKWGANFASGTGSYFYNTCTPSCAAGTLKHHPVTFSLYRPKTVSGQRLFTRMDVSYAGLTETFDLPTSGI